MNLFIFICGVLLPKLKWGEGRIEFAGFDHRRQPGRYVSFVCSATKAQPTGQRVRLTTRALLDNKALCLFFRRECFRRLSGGGKEKRLNPPKSRPSDLNNEMFTLAHANFAKSDALLTNPFHSF